MSEQQTALAVPEQDDDEALAIVVEAEELVVDSQEAFEYAAVVRKTVKDLIAKIEGFWKPLKQAQDQAKAKILDQERSQLAQPKKVLDIINGKLADYETAKRREKAIAEARAAEEARRIEAARPKPVVGAPPPMPVVVPAAPVQMPKAQGLGFFTTYTLEEDVQAGGRMALIKAVAGGWGTAMVLEPNLPMLRDLVSTSKGSMKVPGYRVVEARRPRG